MLPGLAANFRYLGRAGQCLDSAGICTFKQGWRFWQAVHWAQHGKAPGPRAVGAKRPGPNAVRVTEASILRICNLTSSFSDCCLVTCLPSSKFLTWFLKTIFVPLQILTQNKFPFKWMLLGKNLIGMIYSHKMIKKDFHSRSRLRSTNTSWKWKWWKRKLPPFCSSQVNRTQNHIGKSDDV